MYGRAPGKTFPIVLEAGCVLCTAWIKLAFGSSIYPEANGCSQLEFSWVSEKRLTSPKGTGFPLTGYNPGSSAQEEDVSWKRAPETFLFNQDTTAQLCESLLRP